MVGSSGHNRNTCPDCGERTVTDPAKFKCSDCRSASENSSTECPKCGCTRLKRSYSPRKSYKCKKCGNKFS